MSRPPARWGLGLLAAAVAGTLGCPGGGPWPTEVEPVAHPDLTAAEAVVRQQIAEKRSPLEALLALGRGEARELAGAYGRLGEVYLAYELLDAARACLRNAARLDPGSFLWHYQLGLASRSAGDFGAAADAFAAALQRQPENAPARLHLGEARLALGQTEAARELFVALAEEPRYAVAARSGLGRAALAAGDPAAAEGHFRAVLERQPEAASARHGLAEALRRLGRHAEVEELLKALPAAPGPGQITLPMEAHGTGEISFPDPLAERIAALAVSAGAYLRRGNLALVAGRLDEAADAFRRAVEIDPASTAARRNLALTRRRLGDVAAAVRELEAALAASPDDPQILFDLGNAQLAGGDPEAAAETFGRVVAVAPEHVRARFNLANVLAGLDRWEEAAEQLDAVLESRPDDRRARYLAAMADHHRGRPEEAAAGLRALRADDPSDLAVLRGLVTVYGARRQLGPATEAVDAALELGLPAAETLPLIFDLAELEWRGGHQTAAIARFRQAVELAPGSSDAHTRLANVLQLAGRRDEAVVHFARAVDLEPGNATAWLSEASLHLLRGDWATASRRLEAALAHHPNHPDLQQTLARLLATSPDASLRDGARALVLARRAHGGKPSLESALTVGMALAEAGEFAQAVEWQRRVLQRAAAQGVPRPVQQRIAGYLQLYQSGRPVRVSETGG